MAGPVQAGPVDQYHRRNVPGGVGHLKSATKAIGAAVLTLAAFWFAVRNAGETVYIDLDFVTIRASLPIVVLGSVLLGLAAAAGASILAERKR